MYDLTTREPFRAIQISAPEELKTDADFTQLFHYLISEFHRSINAFTAQYGYNHRRQLLGALAMVLKGYMPKMEPELVEDYPASLDKIELLIAQTLVEAVGRLAA